MLITVLQSAFLDRWVRWNVNLEGLSDSNATITEGCNTDQVLDRVIREIYASLASLLPSDCETRLCTKILLRAAVT
jgi:hypothetical protein